LSEKKQREFYKENLGRSAKVIFENDVKENKIFGFTDNYLRVSTEFDSSLINALKTVTLVDLNPDGSIEGRLKESSPILV